MKTLITFTFILFQMLITATALLGQSNPQWQETATAMATFHEMRPYHTDDTFIRELDTEAEIIWVSAEQEAILFLIDQSELPVSEWLETMTYGVHEFNDTQFNIISRIDTIGNAIKANYAGKIGGQPFRLAQYLLTDLTGATKMARLFYPAQGDFEKVILHAEKMISRIGDSQDAPIAASIE